MLFYGNDDTNLSPFRCSRGTLLHKVERIFFYFFKVVKLIANGIGCASEID